MKYFRLIFQLCPSWVHEIADGGLLMFPSGAPGLFGASARRYEPRGWQTAARWRAGTAAVLATRPAGRDGRAPSHRRAVAAQAYRRAEPARRHELELARHQPVDAALFGCGVPAYRSRHDGPVRHHRQRVPRRGPRLCRSADGDRDHSPPTRCCRRPSSGWVRNSPSVSCRHAAPRGRCSVRCSTGCRPSWRSCRPQGRPRRASCRQ